MGDALSRINSPNASTGPSTASSSVPQMDDSTNRQIWQRIVDNSMIGVGIFTHAVICNAETGKIFACAPADFDPSADELKRLAAAVMRPSQLAESGMMLHKLHFQYQSGQVGSHLYGVDTNHCHRGMIVSLGNRLMVVAVYDKNEREAKTTMEELVEYFSTQYEF